MTASYLDDSLATFLDLVAKKQPAPGGGAVAAVTVSLAASLVVMTARYSTDRMNAREEGSGDRMLEEAERLLARTGPLADADAEAYSAVIAAYTAAREHGENGGRERIRAAMVRATEVPLEIADIGAETARLAALLLSEGKSDLHGDAITALLLAEAATRSAAQLVMINVESVGGDHELASRARSHVARARYLGGLVE